MLSFDGFKKKLITELQKDEKFANIQSSYVQKNNETLNTIYQRPEKNPENKEKKLGYPVVYVESLYSEYLKYSDFEDILENAKKMLSKLPVAINLSSKDILNNVYFTLVNTENNTELLEKIVNRKLDHTDLSIVYHVSVGNIEKHMASYSYKLNNEMMVQFGLTENELYQHAKENTPQILGDFKITSLCETIKQLMADDEVIQDMQDEMVDVYDLKLITNKQQINGANALLYPEQLDKICAAYGEDIYILPSSIHEVMCMPKSMGELKQLQSMVADINMTNVLPQERLSNQIYEYSAKTKVLVQATHEYGNLRDDLSKSYVTKL